MVRCTPNWCVAGLSLLTVAACDGGSQEGAGSFDIQLAPPDTVVSLASDLLGRPTDISVDSSGRIWIADAQLHRLLVIHPDGGEPRFVGRDGQGPGELRGPTRISARDTLVRVIDADNSRVQDYRPDGTSIRDHVISSSMLVGGGALLSDERVAVPTLGQEEALAQVIALDESTSTPIGTPVVPAGFWDLTAMKQTISEGQVPDQFRNAVVLSGGESGTLWLLLQTEAEVRKYSTDGDLIWSRLLDVPEVEESRQAFFRRNTEDDTPWGIHLLTTFVAARELDGRLWILMQSEAQSTLAVFYILDSGDGSLLGRVSVEVSAAANAFAIDQSRDRLYLAISGEAAVLAADLSGIEYGGR